MNLLRAAIRAVLRAWGAIADAASEATSEIWASWLKWADRAKTVGSHAAVGAGAALAGPAAVLDGAAALVGSLGPQRGVTPAQVADAAVAEDEAVHAVAPAPAPLTLAEVVQLQAAALPGGLDQAELPEIPHALNVWLSGMGHDNRSYLARMPVASIQRHIEATGPGHLIRGIDRVPTAAEMRQRQYDVAQALQAMEADGRLADMRAEMLADMRLGADEGGHEVTARGPVFA